jgi:hypothetical protein
MEGQQDKNHKAPQIPESQTGFGVADLLNRTPIGPREAACRAELKLARRPAPPDIQRGGRTIRRMGGSELASDGGAAALARVIDARRFDPREATASDHLAEPESLTREMLDAPATNACPPIRLNRSIFNRA